MSSVVHILELGQASSFGSYLSVVPRARMCMCGLSKSGEPRLTVQECLLFAGDVMRTLTSSAAGAPEAWSSSPGKTLGSC